MRHTVEYEAFVKMFGDFFSKAHMVSTYKAVFLKALADVGDYGKEDLVGKEWICQQDDKIRLDLDFIAVRFAKYYWDMEIAFQMRHIPKGMANQTNPEDDVLMIRLVREEAVKIAREKIIEIVESMSHETLNNADSFMAEIQKQISMQSPPTMQQLASKDMEGFRAEVIKHGIKPEVIKNILTDMPDLYRRERGKNYIELDAPIIGFMKEFGHVIKKALNYMLAEHLEKNNPSARHIAIKINSEMEFESRLETVKGLEVRTGIDG